MRINIYIFMMFSSSLLFSTNIFAEQKKDSVDTLQDPFSRGILKPPQYGSSLDRLKGKNGRMDDFRALDDFRYYRVLGIYENESKPFSDAIEINTSEKNAASYNAYYISLGTFFEKPLAQQTSRDFIATFNMHLNRRAIIIANKSNPRAFADRDVKNKKRSVEDKLTYEVEYGPFNNLDLATATCYFLKSRTNQFSLNCDLIHKRLKHKVETIQDTANSASLGLSQAGLLALKDSSLAFNKQVLMSTSATVYEGEMLGPPDFFIVNINQYGVYLASKFDEVMLIPAVTFPVNTGESLPASAPGAPATPPSNSTGK